MLFVKIKERRKFDKINFRVIEKFCAKDQLYFYLKIMINLILMIEIL